MNVPLVQQVITEMERCQAFNPLSPGSWTRWIGMLQQAGEGAQTVITGDEGKPMSMMELISDAPCEPEPYIDYLIAHYTGYREATWPESKRGALVEADCVMIQIDHFLIQLDDIKRKMHRPLAASSARAGSERQDALDLSALKAVRDELWNKSRSPQGRDEQARYDMAHRINDEINRLGRLASVPAVAAPSVGAATQPTAGDLLPAQDDRLGVNLRRGLCAHLDTLTITGDNIGDIRRRFMVPWASTWNAIVRDETARRELRGAALDAPEQP